MEVADRYHKAFKSFNEYMAAEGIKHSGKKYKVLTALWDMMGDATFHANDTSKYNEFVVKYFEYLKVNLDERAKVLNGENDE